jgi:Protein of unknown function (DUF2934)
VETASVNGQTKNQQHALQTKVIMQTQTSRQTSHGLTREKIASTAYNLWEQAGHPSARELDFWLQAEQQLTQSGGANSADTKSAAKQQITPPATKAVSSSRAQSF